MAAPPLTVPVWTVRCPQGCRADGLVIVPEDAALDIDEAARAAGRAEGLRLAAQMLAPALATVKEQGFPHAIGRVRIAVRDLAPLAAEADAAARAARERLETLMREQKP